MKKLLIIPVMIAAFFVAASTASASFFSIRCHAGGDAQVDPIGQPGVNPSAHLHTFYGATGVTENSTTQSLEASGTSCFAGTFNNQRSMTQTQVKQDTSGLWAPKMYINGHPTNPSYVAEYWSNEPPKFTNMPEGLQMIAGNAHATGPPPMYELYFNCVGRSGASATPNCPSGHTMKIHIDFPQCWDGHGLKPTDVVYAGAPVPFADHPTSRPCPAAFPVQLPRLQMIFHTNLTGDQTKSMTFSSGPWYTLHADYWQSWHSQSFLAASEQFIRGGPIP